MNKADLVAAVAEAAGLARGDAAKAVDGVLDAITAALKEGGEVRLVGFGTFSATDRAAGEGRNPRTGEKIAIPACRHPKLSAGKGLKEAVNRLSASTRGRHDGSIRHRGHTIVLGDALA